MKRRLYARDNQAFEPIEIVENEQLVTISYKGKTIPVDLIETEKGQFNALINGESIVFSANRVDSETVEVATLLDYKAIKIYSERQKLAAERYGAASSEAAEGQILAPMPGLILRIEVAAGDEVTAGQPLLIMEAMKMENEIKSPLDGIISKISVADQTAVEKDDLMMVITGKTA